MAILTCPNCGTKNRVDSGKASKHRPLCGKCGTPLDSVNDVRSTPLEVTDATFARDVLGAGKTPVVVDCWAPWCGPCRALGPTIDKLAEESQGRYLVAKLNTDKNPETAGRYKISSIPALLFFKNGRLVDQLVGVRPKQTIAARLGSMVGQG